MRLVATDIDGTIVRADGDVSERVAAAVQAVEAAGIPVVLVTGRPPRWLPPVAERLGIKGLAVCSNGALVYDIGADELVASHLLDDATALAVADVVRDSLPGVAFAVESTSGFSREPSYIARWDAGLQERVAPLPELLHGATAKLLVRHEQLTADEMLTAVRDEIGDRAEVTHSVASGAGLLEVSAAGVSKASTLSRLCRDRGLGASDVLAFGDMPNDLAMLSWAGVAYAMANAHPDVLAVVDRVAPDVEDDGVAQVLEELLDKQLC